MFFERDLYIADHEASSWLLESDGRTDFSFYASQVGCSCRRHPQLLMRVSFLPDSMIIQAISWTRPECG
jgi:hypothetical protein